MSQEVTALLNAVIDGKLVDLDIMLEGGVVDVFTANPLDRDKDGNHGACEFITPTWVKVTGRPSRRHGFTTRLVHVNMMAGLIIGEAFDPNGDDDAKPTAKPTAKPKVKPTAKPTAKPKVKRKVDDATRQVYMRADVQDSFNGAYDGITADLWQEAWGALEDDDYTNLETLAKAIATYFEIDPVGIEPNASLNAG